MLPMALLFCFACNYSLAEDVAENESAPQLEPFEITAFHFPTDTLKTPVHSTVITRETIEKNASVTIPEVLQKEAGLMFRSYGASTEGSIGMRGFGENADSRILVLVDGQRYNRPDMAPIAWSAIPLSSVESIEVLHGSQSAMYGDNAVAGVIKITTKKNVEKNSVELSGVYGSYGLYMANVSGTYRKGDVFVRGDLTRLNDDGYRAFSRAWTNSANASVGYDFNKDNRLIISGNYSESYMENPDALSWDDFRNDPRSGDLSLETKSKAGTYSALFENESAVGRGEVLFGANFRNRDSQRYWSGFPSSPSCNEQLGFSFAPRYEITSVENMKIYFGASVNYAMIDSDIYGYGTGILETTADVDKLDLGIYGGVDYNVTEDFSITAVGRAEASRISAKSTAYSSYPVVDPSLTFSDNSWMGGFAGSLGLNYKVTKTSSVYARFDQIYRYPSTDEIAFYQGYGGGGGINFNRDLKPETGQNFEVGYKYVDKEWKANANFFALYMQNEIMYDNNTWLNQNLDPTFRYGVDLNLAYDSKYWGAFGALSITQAEFVKGDYKNNTLPFVPLINCNFGVYVKPIEDLTILARVTYMSEQYQGSDFTNSLRKMPDAVLFDLQVNYTICEYASAYFAVENIGDERYAAYAYGDSFYSARGRSFKIGINLRF